VAYDFTPCDMRYVSLEEMREKQSEYWRKQEVSGGKPSNRQLKKKKK
jgi:hypothetical protein